MYRPQKRKFVRRVSAASMVAVVAAGGLAITLFNQTHGQTSAVVSTPVTSPTAASASVAHSSTPPSAKYRLVSTSHDDGPSSEDSSND